MDDEDEGFDDDDDDDDELLVVSNFFPVTTLFLIRLVGLTGLSLPSPPPSPYMLLFVPSSGITVPLGKRSAQHAGRPRKVPVTGSHSTWRVRSTKSGSLIVRRGSEREDDESGGGDE